MKGLIVRSLLLLLSHPDEQDFWLEPSAMKIHSWKPLGLPIFTAMAAMLLALPDIAYADIATGVFEHMIFMAPLIVLIEAGYVRFCAFLLKYPISFSRILVVLLLANIATTVVGIVLSFQGMFVITNRVRYSGEYLNLMVLALVLSIFIEWGVFIPFFRKTAFRISDLFRISFVCNSITHTLVAVMI